MKIDSLTKMKPSVPFHRHVDEAFRDIKSELSMRGTSKKTWGCPS